VLVVLFVSKDFITKLAFELELLELADEFSARLTINELVAAVWAGLLLFRPIENAIATV
jgi:hypothetical protein